MAEHEFRFLAGARGVKTIADRTEALGREIGHQPFGQRITDNGNAIARPDAERVEAEADARDLVEQVDPADLLIDAELFRAQRHLAAPFRNDVEQQAWNRQ